MYKSLLFLIFNRLDTTEKVFEQIKAAKPPKLYIGSDGWRHDVEGEEQKVKAVRDYVLSHIDWPCEVKTKFNDTNLGCGKSVSAAVSWFFDNEEDGIIIEDDCVPDASFFTFCEQMLELYKDNKDVWQISGYNNANVKKLKESYYFSYVTNVWGWASWADRWKHYEFDISNYDEKHVKNLFKNCNFQYYWLNILDMMKRNLIDTWDYQWMFCIFKYKGLCIIPKYNLIENIGSLGVHFNGEHVLLFTKSYSMDNPLIHPDKVEVKKDIMNKVFKGLLEVKNQLFYNKVKIDDRRILIFGRYFCFEYISKRIKRKKELTKV